MWLHGTLQVRNLKSLPIYVEKDPVPVREWMTKRKMNRLKADLEFTSFSDDRSTEPQHVPYEMGYSTAHPLFGKMGALQRRDPLRLAERYEMVEHGERVVEILRYVYLGRIDYLWMEPQGAEAKKTLMENMLAMLFCAAKFAMDDLFYVLIKWFPLKCQVVCGDDNFTESFYKIEYYLRNAVQEPLFQKDMLHALLQMGSSRNYLMLISWDQRWNSLESSFLSTFLDQDDLAIVNEGELLLIIERWNANRDKSTHDVLQVCQCYRQTSQNIDALVQFLLATSIVKEETGVKVGDATSREQRALKLVFKVLKPNNKPVRHYRTSKKEQKQLDQRMTAKEVKKKQEELKKQQEQQQQDDEDLDQFLLVRKEDEEHSWVMKKALAFSLKPFDSLLQKRTIQWPGNYRMRIAFTQKLQHLWERHHEVYIGILYGQNKFFGYLCGVSPFLGVYEIRNVSGVCQRPEQAAFLTGSGNKLELDFDVTIGMPLVNKLHTTQCQICAAQNTVIACDDVQWTAETLAQGVRFQIIPIGLEIGDEVDCRITWVANGSTSAKGEEL
ncbi:unnamed protein product [Amoebophrya sp. A120]|nr:unnamed protein product [Amoebophrya sp. A120]|eukprot:GSA120T00017985001.1